MEKEKEIKQEFLKTYVPGFDALIGEGIPAGSAVLVEGGPGSGKTIFCFFITIRL
jgi:KaiC/GvpD/RAD55 family RecA-like ATPase